MGGPGRADPDPMLYRQSLGAIEPEVSAEDALGKNKSGGLLQVFASEE